MLDTDVIAPRDGSRYLHLSTFESPKYSSCFALIHIEYIYRLFLICDSIVYRLFMSHVAIWICDWGSGRVLRLDRRLKEKKSAMQVVD